MSSWQNWGSRSPWRNEILEKWDMWQTGVCFEVQILGSEVLEKLNPLVRYSGMPKHLNRMQLAVNEIKINISYNQ